MTLAGSGAAWSFVPATTNVSVAGAQEDADYVDFGHWIENDMMRAGDPYTVGRRLGDGTIDHRPGRDVTFSAPKSVSIAALIGGDARIVAAHDAAVQKTLAWIEENVVETRTMDADSGRMVRTGDRKAVIATFRHEVSRNLDPQLHTHAAIANMVQGVDAKWRTMANEKLYASKMLIGALYTVATSRLAPMRRMASIRLERRSCGASVPRPG